MFGFFWRWSWLDSQKFQERRNQPGSWVNMIPWNKELVVYTGIERRGKVIEEIFTPEEIERDEQLIREARARIQEAAKNVKEPVKKIVDNWEHSYNLKRQIIRMCRYLTIDDLSRWSDDGGYGIFDKTSNKPDRFFYFDTENHSGVKMISENEIKKFQNDPSKKYIKLKMETVRDRIYRYTDIDYIDDDRVRKKMHSKADAEHRKKILRRESEEILTAARVYSKPEHIVNRVSDLKTGDELYLRLEGKAEAYSIKIKDDSIFRDWNGYAICNIVYRGWPIEWKYNARKFSNVLMRLPLIAGKNFVCTYNGKYLIEVKRVIEKIYFNPFKNQQQH